MPEELKNEEEHNGVKSYEEFISELDKVNNSDSKLGSVEVVRIRKYVKDILDDLERTSARVDELQEDFDTLRQTKDDEIKKMQEVNRELMLNYGLPNKSEVRPEVANKKTLRELLDEEEERGEM